MATVRDRGRRLGHKTATFTVSIDVAIVGDGIAEGQEMFVLHLNASPGAPILDPDGVVTIADPSSK